VFSLQNDDAKRFEPWGFVMDLPRSFELAHGRTDKNKKDYELPHKEIE